MGQSNLPELIRQLAPYGIVAAGLSMAAKNAGPRCPACDEPLKITVELRYPPEEEEAPEPARKPRRRRKVAKKKRRGRK